MTQPIEYVAERVRGMWQQSHSKAIINRFFRWLGGANSAEVIYVAEFAEGDWNNASLKGSPTRVWVCRGEEFNEIDAIGEMNNKNAIASFTPAVRYCVSGDCQRMIYVSWHGYRAASGQILRRVEEKWKSEGRIWVS